MKKKRVNVTIPENARSMFNWLRNYDPTMTSDVKVAAYLMKLGAEYLMYSSLEKVEPLEDDIYKALVKRLAKLSYQQEELDKYDLKL